MSCARSSRTRSAPASRTCWRCAATRRRASRRSSRSRAASRYASELVDAARARVRVLHRRRGYPEKHPEAIEPQPISKRSSARSMPARDFLITQLFFDNAHYFEFVERARARGHHACRSCPGIMPITNYDQIARFTAMCGATIPPRLLRELEARARTNPKPSRSWASPTRRCSARSCSSAARRASTSTRSTSRRRRARSSRRCSPRDACAVSAAP